MEAAAARRPLTETTGTNGGDRGTTAVNVTARARAGQDPGQARTGRNPPNGPPGRPAGRRGGNPGPARGRQPGRRRARHAEGHERHRADQDRETARRARRHRHAQAGADLPDPARARREERPAVLGRRARDPARRLRLPARSRLQLPARSRRHLRLPFADPQVRPAHRRHGVGTDPPAEGGRALLRADQGRGGQLRAAREDAREDLLREPDAALSAGTDPARDRCPTTCRRGSWT